MVTSAPARHHHTAVRIIASANKAMYRSEDRPGSVLVHFLIDTVSSSWNTLLERFECGSVPINEIVLDMHDLQRSRHPRSKAHSFTTHLYSQVVSAFVMYILHQLVDMAVLVHNNNATIDTNIMHKIDLIALYHFIIRATHSLICTPHGLDIHIGAE